MTKAALLLALVAAACATPREPATAAESPAWGDETAGLRCRIHVATSAAQGDALAVAIDFDVGATARGLDAAALESHDVAEGASLVLTAADGRRIDVRPYDPDSGMPDPPDPDARPRPAVSTSARVGFPLARAWDALVPGVYAARVTIDCRPRGSSDWAGTISSPAFTLRVEPSPPREETFLLPKALRVVEITFTTRDDGGGVETTIPVRQVVYGKDDAEEVRLPRRNGFFLGTNLLRDGEMYGTLGGATIEPDGPNPIDSSHGSGPDAQKLGASYTIVIFETADAPEHMWHAGPGSGGYRELWRRTIAVTPAR